jgi:hypothetical protein
MADLKQFAGEYVPYTSSYILSLALALVFFTSRNHALRDAVKLQVREKFMLFNPMCTLSMKYINE